MTECLEVEGELWLPIPGYDDYEASSLGRIRSTPRRVYVNRASGGHWRVYGKTRVLSQERFTAPGGLKDIYHARVPLGQGRRALVHRLVAAAFHGAPEDGQCVRHLNNDSMDNRSENLVWGTHAENMHDKVRHGSARNGNVGKTHCIHGHQLAGDNLRMSGNERVCVECTRRRSREYARRKRALSKK